MLGHGLVREYSIFVFVLFKCRFLTNVLLLSTEYLWGFPLGQRLKDVRLKGAYLKGGSNQERRRQLDALGFVWKPKRGRKKAPVIA